MRSAQPQWPSVDAISGPATIAVVIKGAREERSAADRNDRFMQIGRKLTIK